VNTSGLLFFKINATSAPFKLGIEGLAELNQASVAWFFSTASTPSTASPQISVSA